MTTTSDRRPLAELPAELRAAYGQTVSYSAVWRRAIEGAIPVERVGGRLFWNRADRDRIREALGLRQPLPAA